MARLVLSIRNCRLCGTEVVTRLEKAETSGIFLRVLMLELVARDRQLTRASHASATLARSVMLSMFLTFHMQIELPRGEGWWREISCVTLAQKCIMYGVYSN